MVPEVCPEPFGALVPDYTGSSVTREEEAGAGLGLCLYGSRTLMSLRLEKSWGVWTLDYRPDFTAAEAGLDRFINFDKDFIGREAALAEHEAGPAKRLVTLVVDADDTDCAGDEAVFQGGDCIGHVSSGGYAHCSGVSVAMAYVPVESLSAGDFEVEILGEKRPARVQAKPLYDPAGALMRG